MVGIKKYNSYIMAGHESHNGGNMYYCFDENMEEVKDLEVMIVHTYCIYVVGASRPHVNINY